MAGKNGSYRNTRPDSPKGRIFTAFTEKGADAALKLAEKLDVTPSRVRRWIANGFNYLNDARREAAEAEQAAAKAAPAKKSPAAKAGAKGAKAKAKA
jgi:hypothetical protein